MKRGFEKPGEHLNTILEIMNKDQLSIINLVKINNVIMGKLTDSDGYDSRIRAHKRIDSRTRVTQTFKEESIDFINDWFVRTANELENMKMASPDIKTFHVDIDMIEEVLIETLKTFSSSQMV